MLIESYRDLGITNRFSFKGYKKQNEKKRTEFILSYDSNFVFERLSIERRKT